MARNKSTRLILRIFSTLSQKPPVFWLVLEGNLHLSPTRRGRGGVFASKAGLNEWGGGIEMNASNSFVKHHSKGGVCVTCAVGKQHSETTRFR